MILTVVVAWLRGCVVAWLSVGCNVNKVTLHPRGCVVVSRM